MRYRLLYVLIFCLHPNIMEGQVTESDSIALVALYHSTNGESWTDHTNWLQPGQPVSSWYGIHVLDTIVERISLDQNNLTGVLPEEIGNLNHLKVLELKMNQIAGEIPSSIGNLAEIEILSLRSNHLVGPIPPEIGNLVNLEYLYLFENQLDGPIPTEIGNLIKLDYLLLQNNLLSGPIPEEMGQLIHLTTLSLNDNTITDSIPAEIGNLINLTELNLGRNELSGHIPPEIGNLTRLFQLNLSVNKLDGSIPSTIGDLINLTWLGLHMNQIEGPIPPEIGNLVELTYLSLRDNNLSGPIPSEIGNLTNLHYLSLYKNQLTSLPDQLGNLKNLKGLYLRYNHLQGDIPREIGNLDSLEVLSLENNQLTGTIPVEIGHLKKLTDLDLHANMIGGTIPEEITNLTSLENLDLNRNELEGPIPRGIKDLPVLSSLNLSMNRFNFHDLEPFIGNSLSNFYYGFQAPLGLRLNQLNQSTGDDLDVDITLLTNHPCMAEKNQYQWWKDGFYLTPYSDSPVLNLTGLDTTAAGGYICTMTHVDFPDLILVTDTLYLVIDDPVDIILSPDTIDENSPSGSLVGMLTAIESGQIGGHEFSLTPFNGIVDEDNELFMVQLDSLFISVSPDFETKNEYQIFVTATNQNHRTFGKALFVYINDIQEPATNTLTHRPTGRARLFPNPFNDYIMIELASPESGPVQVELLDLQGKLLQSRQYGVLKSVGELKMRLSIDPALPSGIYLISLSFGNLRERLKVIKE